MSAQIHTSGSATTEEYEPQIIDKWDMSEYNDAEKTMDQIFKETDEIVDVYIINNVPDLKNIDSSLCVSLTNIFLVFKFSDIKSA